MRVAAAFYVSPLAFSLDRFMSIFPWWSPEHGGYWGLISNVILGIGFMSYVGAAWMTSKTIEHASMEGKSSPLETLKTFFWVLCLPIGIWFVRDRVLRAGAISRSVDVF
jgi:hypothetical protein